MWDFWQCRGRLWLTLFLLAACSSDHRTGQKEALSHSVVRRFDIRSEEQGAKEQEGKLQTLEGQQEPFSLAQPSLIRRTEGKVDLINTNPHAEITTQSFLAAMGPPLLKNREADSERWVYRTEKCVLDAFFYRGKLSHMEARDLGADELELSVCLEDYQ